MAHYIGPGAQSSAGENNKMKKQITKNLNRLIVSAGLLVSLIFATPFASMAGGGGMDSSGGDGFALEFVQIAHELLTQLSSDTTSSSQKVNLEQLSKAIETTRVESVDENLILDGVLKDAINSPSQKLITINRKSWEAMQNPRSKVALVLHEYLGIMGTDDTKYQLSSIILGGGYTEYMTDGNAFVAEPNSPLAMYDEQASLLKNMTYQKDYSSIKKQSVKILQEYFGFTEIRFASYFGFGSEREIDMAAFMAMHLREILPADFNRNSYLAVNTNFISSKPMQQGEIIHPPSNKIQFILTFDDRISSIKYDAELTSLPNRTIKQFLTFGFSNQIMDTYTIKRWMSTLLNSTDFLYNSVNYDIPFRH